MRGGNQEQSIPRVARLTSQSSPSGEVRYDRDLSSFCCLFSQRDLLLELDYEIGLSRNVSVRYSRNLLIVADSFDFQNSELLALCLVTD